MQFQFQQVITWAFEGLLSGCIVYAVGHLNRLRESIESLNVRIAVVTEKSNSHERELERQNTRIGRLEQLT